jgi:hypothetical protein
VSGNEVIKRASERALGAVAVAPPASGYATATSGSAIELGLKPFHAQ